MPIFANKKQEYAGVMNVFWQEPMKRDVMGYRLTNVADGDVILPGTPIQTNEANKTAVVCHYAYVKAVALDKKTLTVERGHHMPADASVAISGGDTLTALSLASVEDEKIVLSEANNDIAAGDILVEVVSTTVGEGQDAVTTVSAKNVPNRIVNTMAEIDSIDKTCSAAHEGWVLQNIVHYPEEYLNKTVAPGTIYLAGCLGLKFMIQ